MKVIARMDRRRVLIEATVDEVAKLIGEPSESTLARKSGRYADSAIVEPGLTIKVDDAWERLKSIESVPDTLRRLDTLAKSIQLAVGTHLPVYEHALANEEGEHE